MTITQIVVRFAALAVLFFLIMLFAGIAALPNAGYPGVAALIAVAFFIVAIFVAFRTGRVWQPAE